MKAVRRELVVSILGAAFLAGCASWSRPNTAPAELDKDRSACQESAARQYPVESVQRAAGVPTQANCYGSSANCNTTAGAPPPALPADANAGNRLGAFNSCMTAKGYTLRKGVTP